MVGSATAAARTVGRYAIFDEIASGGMATVYIGRLMGLGGFARTVAIKSMHPQFAKDPEFVSMFLDEARIVARIRHPNVVPTLDVVAQKGEVFLVMDYVQGETLSHLVKRLDARGERVPIPILLRIMSDTLQGLHAAHEARDEQGLPLEIVHRDVSPHNILVGCDGIARLLDFGVAKAAGRGQTTSEGRIKGKLAYMAPEQLLGDKVTRQTDIYAASVIFWEALTGTRLFTANNNLDLHARVNHKQIRRPSELVPDLPRELEDVVMRGLAGRIEERFASARDMCAALGKCGFAEAPAIVVGEWVESNAAEVLAQRTAKIAAIASGFDNSVDVPVSEPPPRPTSPILAPQPVVPGEAHGSALSISIDTAVLRRGTQVRVWGLAGALALLLGLVGFAFVNSVHREQPHAGLPDPSSQRAAATPLPAIQPEAAPAHAPIEPSPEPSAVAQRPPPTRATASQAQTTPIPAARAPSVRKPPVASKARAPSDPFDSRE